MVYVTINYYQPIYQLILNHYMVGYDGIYHLSTTMILGFASVWALAMTSSWQKRSDRVARESNAQLVSTFGGIKTLAWFEQCENGYQIDIYTIYIYIVYIYIVYIYIVYIYIYSVCIYTIYIYI